MSELHPEDRDAAGWIGKSPPRKRNFNFVNADGKGRKHWELRKALEQQELDRAEGKAGCPVKQK